LKLTTCVAALLFTGLALGQTPIQTVTFTTEGEGYTTNKTYSDGNDYWIRTNGGPEISTTYPFTNIENSWFFAGEDVDGYLPVYLTTNAANITGYSNLQLKFLLGAKDDEGSKEAGDYVKVEYAIDGGAYTTIAQFLGDPDEVPSTLDFFKEDTNLDGVFDADGTELRYDLQEFTYSIPGSGNSIQVRFSVSNGGGEEVAIDYIRITGDLSLSVGLSSFSGTVEEGAVVLHWSTESELNNTGFILERQVEGDAVWETLASYETSHALTGQGSTSSQTEYTYKDITAVPGETYTYRLSDVSSEGKVTLHAPLTLTHTGLPETFYMENAHPNPFNPETRVTYHLKESAWVNITVFNCLGKHVKTLYDNQQSAGSYHVFWNGSNAEHVQVPSGPYIVRMKTAGMQQIQKIMLLK